MSKSVCEENNYKEVYERHSEHLRNFMYYRCGSLDKAEDLMHESFVKLWENCKKVIFEKVKSYLFTIANRLFLNDVEHQKVVLSFEKDFSIKQSSETPQYILEEKEFKHTLEKAIGNLPQGQREVFLLNRIDKMTFQEIADMQGIGLSAVHKKMYKAMAKLKAQVHILNNRKI